MDRIGPYADGFDAGYVEAIGRSAKVSNVFTLDLATGNVFDITLTANSTIALQGRPTKGTVYSFMVIVRLTGGPWTLTGPAAFKYPSAAAPTYSASSVNVITAVSVDGGTTFLVSAAGFSYS